MPILKENEEWLRGNGYITANGVEFSDRFIAIKSGTTREGNSMKAPLEAIRKHGLIPKMLLPRDPSMTFEQYHDPRRITPNMEKIGQEFLSRFTINYEKVFELHYEELLREDLLNFAGFAWPDPVDGIYPKVPNDPNHVFVGVKRPKYVIFDNYEEAPGDFIKVLAPDFDLLDYGYRLYITKQTDITKQLNWLQDIVKNLWEAVRDIFVQRGLPVPEVVKENIEPKKEELKVELPPKYLWDTKDNSRHSVRVICDEENLAIWDKNLICAVIQAESNFDNKAINHNKNTKGQILSTDWGICQINDYYHVGPGKPFRFVKDIKDNPEKAVRWMILMYKAKKIHLWVAYSSGAYKRFL